MWPQERLSYRPLQNLRKKKKNCINLFHSVRRAVDGQKMNSFTPSSVAQLAEQVGH